MIRIFHIAIIILLTGVINQFYSQEKLPIIPYGDPKEFEIGGIKITGNFFSDAGTLQSISGLKVGDKIKVPGPDFERAIQNLWKLKLFTQVEIQQEKRLGDVIFLLIKLEERPRLSRFSYKGIKKGYHDDLNEEVEKFITKGSIITENAKRTSANAIEKYFIDKGYLNAHVVITELKDTSYVNSVRLVYNVDRGDRVKIKDIVFSGNINNKSKKLRKQMDDTHRKSKLLSSSKFIEKKYEADKEKILDYYNKEGYRDAVIVKDSIWRTPKDQLMIKILVDEGTRYYFRDISWKGNTIYDENIVNSVLGIKKGDVFNKELLEKRLSFSIDGRDVSSLYLDNGYLFFQANPVEIKIEKDSVDLEIRIYEGPQATIDRVVINGNDRTHEHVIRRELRTLPGDKFSRAEVIRSQRQILALGYFNAENLGLNTPVNPQRGTVDIEYKVEERPSDQLELSAGWGGPSQGVIGTLGVTFNNFSLRNILNKEAWHPLPQGDGQRLSIRAQSNGRFYQSYNFSFTEPWLGGKKPTSFSINLFNTKVTSTNFSDDNLNNLFSVVGGSVGLGTRMKFPDDNFISNTSISFQRLKLKDWTAFSTQDGDIVNSGSFYNININQTFTRTTINEPIFPKSGSRFTLLMQLTPPYSLFRKNFDYKGASIQDRFELLEYHKWRFTGEWFTGVGGKFVLRTAAKIGILGFYNKDIGISPFEQFQIGGDGFAQQQFNNFLGVDIIALRGYDINELDNNLRFNRSTQRYEQSPAPIFSKFTMELRYPISLNPSSTIFVMAFAEGGNSWRRVRDFNPFDLNRSVGLGLRVALPMFGILGFDYGLGIDKSLPEGSAITKYGRFNIILGIEPD